MRKWSQLKTKRQKIRRMKDMLKTFIWRRIKWPLETLWYWIRTHTYDRYHIINLKSPKNGYKWGWLDRDQAILYACFNILVEFVEKEHETGRRAFDPKPFNAEPFLELSSDEEWLSWQRSVHEENEALKLEVAALYDWWTHGRSEDWRRVDNIRFSGSDFNNWADELQAIEKRDDEMLLRLMKIRNYLWT